jgi:hypothetical protein
VQHSGTPDCVGDFLLGGEPAESPAERLVQRFGDRRHRGVAVREGDRDDISLEGLGY